MAKTYFRNENVGNTAVEVRASKGRLLAINVINRHTSDIFVKLYDKAAASITATGDDPAMTRQIPASGSVVIDDIGIAIREFETAISVRAVTGSGDNDITDPTTRPIIEITHDNLY